MPRVAKQGNRVTTPVTLTEAKAHMRVSLTDDDALITALIHSATDYIERYTHRVMVNTDFTLYLDEFPGAGAGSIELPFAPIDEVTEVRYVDTAGVTQIASSALYTLDPSPSRPFVHLTYNSSWPSTHAVHNAVEVDFTAGYGHAGDHVPNGLRQAVLLLVASWYENREAVITGTIVTKVPFAVESLMRSYQWIKV